MANYYVLGSRVGGSHVPVGKVHFSRAPAEAAARDLNHCLPGLRLEVLEIAKDDLNQQPPEIREYVERHAGGQG
jgi:hypothetical protein